MKVLLKEKFEICVRLSLEYLYSHPSMSQMETWVSVSSRLKPAVILIVMRKRLMCSSCILWPTLCSAICLCQPPPLGPPTLLFLLKSPGSLDRDCSSLGLLWPHVAWSAPSALLVKPSLTRFLAVDVEWHLRWQLVGQRPHKPAATNAWGPTETSALTIADGAEPAQHIHATGRQRHSAGQSSSPSLCFYLLLPLLQPHGNLLGRSYPAIFSPSTEWPPKGVLWKLATWPHD